MELLFSAEQKRFIDDVLAGENVLAIGPAGSGKSTLLNFLRGTLGSKLSVCASTGIAAMNVHGSTLHSFAGLGLGVDSAQSIAEEVCSNPRSRAYRNITRCSILAIDEISMVSAELFDKIEHVFRIARERDVPFGGVQLVLFGDFLQLPPISKGPEQALFAFESEAWKKAGIRTHLFTQVFRQADQPFADALGRLRVGDLHHPSIALIGARNNIPLPEDGIRPVVIHTHNADVDRLNILELEKIPGPEFSFSAVDTGGRDEIDRLNRDCLAPQTLRLKKDAQVMLLTNLDVADGLVNGSLGIVVGLEADEISVRFGTDTVVSMARHSWKIKNNQQVIAERSQYPLRLAYALSCHKTQGMTLDRIECHLEKVFEYGQAYVAVSRVKTIDGLFLRRSTRHNFRAHPKAVAFYQDAATTAVTKGPPVS